MKFDFLNDINKRAKCDKQPENQVDKIIEKCEAQKIKKILQKDYVSHGHSCHIDFDIGIYIAIVFTIYYKSTDFACLFLISSVTPYPNFLKCSFLNPTM